MEQKTDSQKLKDIKQKVQNNREDLMDHEDELQEIIKNLEYKEKREEDFDFMNEISKANKERCKDFGHDLNEWNGLEWAGALAGEVGELSNLLKKVKRGDASFEEYEKDLKDEVADVFMYLNLLSCWADFDLKEISIRKFNEKSEDIGSNIYIEDGRKKNKKNPTYKNMMEDIVKRVSHLPSDAYHKFGPDIHKISYSHEMTQVDYVISEFMGFVSKKAVDEDITIDEALDRIWFDEIKANVIYDKNELRFARWLFGRVMDKFPEFYRGTTEKTIDGFMSPHRSRKYVKLKENEARFDYLGYYLPFSSDTKHIYMRIQRLKQELRQQNKEQRPEGSESNMDSENTIREIEQLHTNGEDNKNPFQKIAEMLTRK